MRGSADGRWSADEAWRALNGRQRAFLDAIVDADAEAGGAQWLRFLLDPAPGDPRHPLVVDRLRAAGWSARGTRSTLRALFDRGLVDIRHGVAYLPDGRLADSVKVSALDRGRQAARAGRQRPRPTGSP